MQGPDRTQENTTDHEMSHLHTPTPPNHANTETETKTERASLKSCSGTEVPPPACVKSEPRTPSCDHKKTTSASDTAAAKLSGSTVCSGAHAVKPQKSISDTGLKGQKSTSPSSGNTYFSSLIIT